MSVLYIVTVLRERALYRYRPYKRALYRYTSPSFDERALYRYRPSISVLYIVTVLR